jgi:hypothetical protein
MAALARIGYEGPITTEPFNEPINQMAALDPQKAARKVSLIMDSLWVKAGLS